MTEVMGPKGYTSSDATLVLEPIRGFRWVRVDEEGSLRSCTNYNKYSLDETNIAFCTKTRVLHDAPLPYCSCGFWGLYGVKGPFQPKVYLSIMHSLQHYAPITIKAFGRIVLGEIGFRAEKCIIEHVGPVYLFSSKEVNLVEAPHLSAMISSMSIEQFNQLESSDISHLIDSGSGAKKKEKEVDNPPPQLLQW